jgi:hypothetical protein
MKKVVILVSTVLLFAGMTFGQAQQSQDKAKPATTKTETPAKKDGKDCEKTCTHKGKEKSGCCAHKSTECKKDAKTTTTPEKK